MARFWWIRPLTDSRLFVVVFRYEVPLGVVVVVDPGLAAVEVWWWDPFGAAVFAFSGCPGAGFDLAVVFGAGQGEVVDVGLAVVGPICHRVVDLAVRPGHGAAGAGTAAVSGMIVQVV